MSPTPAGHDPAAMAVMIDFDGTISVRDVGLHLLERLGDPRWRDLEARYEAGEIGSRDCLARQWSCLPPDEQLLREVAAEVPLDPGAGSLIGRLRRAGAEVSIVSDGFGFYVEEPAGRWRVPVLTNQVDFDRHCMVFPTPRPLCDHGCGTCKQVPIEEAAERGKTVVLVGDGASDRPAATVADLVFARAGLADWCETKGIACIRFERLADVSRALLGPGQTRLDSG